MNRILVTSLTILCSLFLRQAHGNVATSSHKMKLFLENRKNLTDNIENYVQYEKDRLVVLRNSSGYEEEIEITVQRIDLLAKLVEETKKNMTRDSSLSIEQLVDHPVYAYVIIRDFLYNYRHGLSNMTLYGFKVQKFFDTKEYGSPFTDDIRDAMEAILRIQLLYGLEVKDIMNGNFMGRRSPELSRNDAYLIGVSAYNLGYPKLALMWLTESFDKFDTSIEKSPFHWKDALYRLILCLKYMQHSIKAEELIELAIKIDPSDKLFYKLHMQARHYKVPAPRDNLTPTPDWFANYTKLCRQDETVVSIRRFHKCRYRVGFNSVPYYRYKEEVLHHAPYVSLIHDALTDNVTETIKERAGKNLSIRNEFDETGNARYRPGSFGETFELDESILMERDLGMSRMVNMITGMNANFYEPESGVRYPSGEPLKVVNYGVGGHYNLHDDFFTSSTSTYIMKYSGDRMATILFFLSDVEVGGHEIFTRLGISVKPQKNAALWWFNYTPLGYKDYRTIKITCPVVFGQKWEARKGIWNAGNEARYICGKKKRSSQFSIEKSLHFKTRRS